MNISIKHFMIVQFFLINIKHLYHVIRRRKNTDINTKEEKKKRLYKLFS